MDTATASQLTEVRLNPSSTIVAFDLHDVLFHRDKTATFLKAPSVAFQYLRHPSFMWKLRSARSFEDAYEAEHNSYSDKLKGVKRSTLDTANCQTPTDGMIQLLDDLAASGCILYLFSNIGGLVLEDLRGKFPTLFQHFHGFHTPTQENGYAKKPNTVAFTSFMGQANPEGDRTVVFFDDKQANIDEAITNGFMGKKFVSAAKTREYLQDIGILPSETE